MKKIVLIILLTLTPVIFTYAQQKEKILFVLTSHEQKGNTGEKTGYYLSEVSHPWEVLHQAGYEIDFVSPKGGKAPVDGFDLKDSINKKFWKNKTYRYKVEHTLMPSEINPNHYVAIHYAGGHGTMWDFADNEALANIGSQIYQSNGVVSAVCHGPSGLVNIKLDNGNYLIDGKKVNGFTNEEETILKLENVVPYSLEDKLIQRGAIFEKSSPWQPHVTVDQRLVTGQNPQSAYQVGKAILQELQNPGLITNMPALHQAIIANQEARVIELIKNGADVNQLDHKMGNAPLHIAAQLDNPKMIEILIEHGAFVNLHHPHNGQTPLMVATWYSKPENIKALLKAKDINVFARSPYGGGTAKDYVGGWDKNQSTEEKQRYQKLTQLLDEGEKLYENRMKEQKIFNVVINKNLTDQEKANKVNQLIQQGESVNTESYNSGTGNDKHSALLVAVRNNYPLTARVLLENGADIGQRGYPMNAIAFHKAAYMGNTEIMSMLLAHKDALKYINDQGLNNGYTPLHDAIWHGNLGAAKLLISAGARLDLETYEGDTPLELAKRYNYNEIVNLLNIKLRK